MAMAISLLSQDGNPIPEHLLKLREQFVRRLDLEVVAQIKHGLASLRDLKAQTRAARAGKLDQQLLQGPKLIATQQIRVQAHVQHGTALGADGRQQFRVHEAQALARILGIAGYRDSLGM
jgi:hypothetical protein